MQDIWWCHGTRNSREHAFAKEAQDSVRNLRRGHSLIAYSAPDSSDRLGVDYDTQGRLRLSELQKAGVPRVAHFYLCGPTGFIADLCAALTTWGVPDNCIHSEAFGAGTAMTPGISHGVAKAPHPPEGEPGTGPLVAFSRSGLTVPWNPRFGSLLELAEASDVPVRWSCRVGVCHTCETGIIDGEVEYRPEPLDCTAQGRLLICCATPTSDIQIDL